MGRTHSMTGKAGLSASQKCIYVYVDQSPYSSSVWLKSVNCLMSVLISKATCSKLHCIPFFLTFLRLPLLHAFVNYLTFTYYIICFSLSILCHLFQANSVSIQTSCITANANTKQANPMWPLSPSSYCPFIYSPLQQKSSKGLSQDSLSSLVHCPTSAQSNPEFVPKPLLKQPLLSFNHP